MPSRLLALPGLLLGVSLAPAADKLPPPLARKVDFTRDVQPLLTRSGGGCHGPRKQRGGLRLDNGRQALEGGNSGPAFVAGNSAASRLIHLVAGLEADRRRRAWRRPGCGWRWRGRC